MVTHGPLSTVLLMSGLLFWPTYGLLLWTVVRRQTALTLVVTFLWCCQGFWQVIYKTEVMMGV